MLISSMMCPGKTVRPSPDAVQIFMDLHKRTHSEIMQSWTRMLEMYPAAAVQST